MKSRFSPMGFTASPRCSRSRSPAPGPMHRRARAASRAAERGVVLLEALIAIVVFSIGILGLVGMQARSVQMLSEATLRSQAAQHASELIAEMWTTDPSQRAIVYSSGGGSAVRYDEWAARVQYGSRALPGATDAPPVVVVNTVQTAFSAVGAGNSTASQVTVTIFWQPPGAPAASQYTTTALILEPQS